MVRPFKWIAAKVLEASGRIRSANRICGWRIEAACFLRSFVLLAPRQSAMGFLWKDTKQASCQFRNDARGWRSNKTRALSVLELKANCNVLLQM
jgi:hypothetical protein